MGIYENWHLWTGTNNKILLSDESTKTLKSFDDIDQAINYLFLSGNKEAARYFNKMKKGS